MSGKKFEVSAVFPIERDELYNAWLSSTTHSKMTGSKAKTSTREGGKFTAWNGYISGRNVKLLPGKRIVQDWRTTEFEEGDRDSIFDFQLPHVVQG